MADLTPSAPVGNVFETKVAHAMIRRHLPHIGLSTSLAALALSVGLFQGWIPNTEIFAQTRARPKILRDIPYIENAGVKPRHRQSLDLYLPPRTKSKPPLLIFIHGGFWTLSDDDYGIGPAMADVLSAKNVAVALVRYRLAPKYRHPTQANDVAAAVAHLVRKASDYGYDPERIFLAGHSAGAHLAALVALDPSYLSKHRIKSQSLAGVVALSGLYDLPYQTQASEEAKTAITQAFGTDDQALRAASPVTHVRGDAPPFLVLAASSDFNGFRIDARKFAEALRSAGHSHVEQYLIPDRNHFSIVQWAEKYHEARTLCLAFMKVDPLPPELQDLIEAKRRWLNPPVSTAPFWRHEKLIRSFPIDRRFVERLLPVYGPLKYELLEWPLETYYAIDLFAYLDSLPEKQVGRGNYLVITNLRNEKQFWNRRKIARYQPVIVIGIDTERNLFRFGVYYRPLRQYSWKSGPRPPMMARPLGAFIHFLKPPPPEWRPQPPHYALTPESFRLVQKDPLRLLKNLPKELYEVMTHRNGCIYCHSFRKVGSKSHHMLMSTGGPHGGYAMPLESYPPEVWKAFLFDQEKVAAKIGASPNIVEGDARQALYDIVVEYQRGNRTSGR